MATDYIATAGEYRQAAVRVSREAEAAPGAEPEVVPLARMGRRVSAWMIDAVIGLALTAGFIEVSGGASDVDTLWHAFFFKSFNGRTGRELSTALSPGSTSLSALRPLVHLFAILMIIALVAVAYRVVTTARWGAGVGKTLLGLQIVVDTHDGTYTQVPGWARSWKRWIVPQGPGLIPLPATSLLAYVPAFRDSRRRGLHDRAAGTVVVNVRERSASS